MAILTTNNQRLIKEERKYNYYKKAKEYEITKGKENNFESKEAEEIMRKELE